MRKRAKSEFKVMGVDPSLNGTGLCLPCGETRTLNPGLLRGWRRIGYVVGQVEQALIYDEPTHICMEGYAFGRNRMQGTFDMAELGGVMKLLFFSWGLPIVLVPPTTLKLYVTGKGNSPKEVVMKDIKRRWGKSFVDSDKADAFALQQFGIDYLRGAVESMGDVRALPKAETINPAKELQTFAIFR